MRLDFCIIGAMKSATTTLYALLVQHPDIVMAERLTKDCIGKEPGFFSRDERYALGLDWYARHFRQFEGVMVGEASTCYSRRVPFPNAARRLAEFTPDAKLIYVLRHPVQRAFAHYKHEMRRYFTTGRPIPDFASYCLTDPAVLSASEYDLEIEHLLRWFPREQLLLLRFEDLIQQQADTLADVHRWLGVEPIPAQPEWANDSGDALRTQAVKKRMRAVTANPLLKAIAKPFPSPIKARSRVLFEKKIASTEGIEREIQSFEDALVVPGGDEYQALIDRFAGTVSVVENMTGWDLDSWKS